MNHRTEQLIESYFANMLTDVEQGELKAILAEDTKAAAEFAWQQGLAQQVSKLSLAKGIKNEPWRDAAKPPFRTVSMYTKAFAAAAAIAVLIVAYIFIPGTNAESSQEILAQSIEHFPNKMKFKNLGEGAEGVSPDVLEAFAAYDQKNYGEASQKLTEVVNANPTRMDFRFYLGMSFLGQKKYAETINALMAVASDKSSVYSTPARYFLGVAYTGVNDVKQAKRYLQEYIDAEDGVTYKKQAERLLKTLK